MSKTLLLLVSLLLGVYCFSQSDYNIVELRNKVRQKKEYFETLLLSFQEKSKTESNQRAWLAEIESGNNKLQKSNTLNKIICFSIVFVLGITLAFKIKKLPKIRFVRQVGIVLLLLTQTSSQGQFGYDNDTELRQLITDSKNYDWRIEEREKDIELKRKSTRDFNELINKAGEKNYKLKEDTLLSLKNIFITILFFVLGFGFGLLLLKAKKYKVEIH